MGLVVPHFCPAKFPWLFPDFSVFSFHFPVFFQCFNLMHLKNTKVHLTNTLQLKSRRKNKNKNWLKFPCFSSILGKIPSFFQYFGWNSLTFPWLEKVFPFSRFSRSCGNHGVSIYWRNSHRYTVICVCRKPMWSAGNLCDLPILFMRIQNLLTVLGVLCVTKITSKHQNDIAKMMSHTWRQVFPDSIILWITI